MRYAARVIAMLLLALLVSTPGVWAQVLPDLAPREVEIRGDLTISFPSLRRQPLIGFNPPPRVPDMDIRRMPFVEAYKQKSAELPQNPLRNPTSPSAMPRPYGQGYAGTVEAGFGRYSARYAKLETALYASPSTRWTVDLGYDGITSYAPFGSDAAADDLHGATRYSRDGRKASFGVALGGSTDSYTLYGVSRPGTGGAVIAPPRTRTDGNADIWLGTGTESPFNLRAAASFFGGTTETELFTNRQDPASTRVDRGMTGSLTLAAGVVRMDGRAGSVTLDPDNNASPSTVNFDAGAGLALRTAGGAYRVEGGLRILGMEAQPEATGSIRRSATYLSPSFHVETALAPNIRLEIDQRPRVDTPRPGALLKEHPFVSDQSRLEPVLMTIDSQARVTGYWGSFQLAAISTYQESPNWRVYEHAPGLGAYPLGISQISHSKGRLLTIGGEARLAPRPGIEGKLGARFQDGRLIDSDSPLPYTSDWAVEAMVSSSFGSSKGLVQITSELMGPRYRDRARSIRVGTHADLDVRVSWAIGRQMLIAAEARNLLGETPVWDNYPEPPATFLLGLGWRW